VSDLLRHPRVVALDGQRFGMLLVLQYIGVRKESAFWKCACDCGQLTEVSSLNLRQGHTKSCGCLGRQGFESHGNLGRPPEYFVWLGMLSRCYCLGNGSFNDYGGRGIVVCESWRKSFPAFYRDMGQRPTPQHSIDRFPNVNGNYEPGNVRWALPSQQGRNKRSNHLIEFRGKSMCLIEWEEETGIPSHVIRKRLGRGWSISQALTQPRRSNGKR